MGFVALLEEQLTKGLAITEAGLPNDCDDCSSEAMMSYPPVPVSSQDFHDVLAHHIDMPTEQQLLLPGSNRSSFHPKVLYDFEARRAVVLMP